MNLTRRPPLPAAAVLRLNEPGSAFWIRRFLRRGRPVQSLPRRQACSGAWLPRCCSPGSLPRFFSCYSANAERVMNTARIALPLLYLLPLWRRTRATGLLRIGLLQSAEQLLLEAAHQFSERFRPHPQRAQNPVGDNLLHPNRASIGSIPIQSGGRYA